MFFLNNKIDTFEDFYLYIINNQNTYKNRTGFCKNCPIKKECLRDNKLDQIESILNLSEKDSRYPRLLNVIQQVPSFLHIIPRKVYSNMYGNHSFHLQCQFNSNIIVNKLEKIKAVYDALSDEESKKTFINVLMFRLTLDKEYLFSCKSNEKQYFITEFTNLTNNEAVVDCGAFVGDTFTDYIACNEKPNEYYLFEPDNESIKQLKECLLKNECGNYRIINKAVGNKNQDLWFVSNKLSSHISETKKEGATKMSVCRIDDAIDTDISFLKMDIEGSEMAALEGAVEHIEKTSPKLAICIYHSVEDLIEIPYYIINKYKTYNYFKIRHYTHSFTETVFYAYT